VGLEITREAMQAFYETHPPGKQATAESIAEKYKGQTRKLVNLLHEKYGEAPEPVAKKPPGQPAPEGGAATDQNAGKGSQSASLGGASLEELQAELQRRQEEDTSADEVFLAEPPAGDSTAPDKIIIIGGGPAGLSAAIYAARAGLEPLVVAPVAGGQLLGKGVDVENFPGAPGSTGRGIVEVMRKQAHGFKSRLLGQSVKALELSERPFKVILNDTLGSTLYAQTLVIATGADSRWLGVPGEHELRGGGVSSCATCDGFLFRGQQVAVIGGGDTAAEDALVLARTSSKVTMIVRRDRLRASVTMARRVQAHPKITILWSSTVQEFHGKEVDGQLQLSHLSVKDADGQLSRLEARAAFVAIGHIPNTQLLKGLVAMDSEGYLKREGQYSSATSVPGVFGAGDVQDKVYRQAITSAGTGAMAALDAERFLSETA